MPTNEPASVLSWESTVSVREDHELEAELLVRWKHETGERSVGVTDLLSLRRAYYRRVLGPVPIPPDRQARLDQGRIVHRILGSRLAHEGVLEARVRRDGVVGRIDILGELPIEVKTSTAVVEPSQLAILRPDHIEQLGMYCALVDRPTGRLLTLVSGPKGIQDVQAVDVTFGSTAAIREEMRRRSELLRTAWTESRADGLPRCPWYGRGCEFEEAAVCACTGEEKPGSSALTNQVGKIAPQEEVARRIHTSLSESDTAENPTRIQRFRELLYPRRAFYERTRPSPPIPPVSAAPPPSPVRPDLYSRLNEAAESGPPGEVCRLPTPSDELEEEVVGFRGRPLLVRTSRAWARFRPEELVRRAPQYALELGLRCASTGTDSGSILLGFERAEADPDKIQVLELRFTSLTPFSRFFRERSRALFDAVRDQAPGSLPACPEWMSKECAYRSECGCGDAADRSTR